VLVQLALGIAIPMLVYFGLVRLESWIAVGAAIMLALTLVPYLMMGYVMTMELFYSLVMLIVFFTCRFIAGRRAADVHKRVHDLYYIGLASFAVHVVWLGNLRPYHPTKTSVVSAQYKGTMRIRRRVRNRRAPPRWPNRRSDV
jgi:hypothetical protein